jgi:gluconolactonase
MNLSNVFVLLLFLPVTLNAQTSAEIVSADEEFFGLIPRDSKIEQVGQDFQFTEGPVWSVRERCLLFSDIPANKIYKWEPITGKTVVFGAASGNSNGLAFDKLGWLLACEHGTRSITVRDKSGHVIPIVSSFKGKKLNSPNDLVVHASGAIFFTDPPYGLPKGNKDEGKELSFNGVFVYKGRDIFLLDSTLSGPNGIALSPDQKYLYVSNSQNDGIKSWFRYELTPNLTVKAKTEIMRAPDQQAQGGPDGMKIDSKGNFYCTGPGGLLVFNKEGKYLGLIKLPEIPTNCAFGDADGKTLYITDRTHVFKIRTLVAGK